MRLPRILPLCLAALTLAACAGSPSTGNGSKQPAAPTTIMDLIEEPVLGGIDLRSAWQFRIAGEVPGKNGFALQPLSGFAPRRYAVNQVMQDAVEMLVWCSPKPGKHTLGIAVCTQALERIEDTHLEHIGLQRKQALGLIEAAGPLVGNPVYATDRDNCLLAGVWVVIVFDPALREQFRIGDGTSLASHGQVLIANERYNAARELVQTLRSSGEPSAVTTADQIAQELAKRNEQFEADAHAAWKRIEQRIQTSDYGKAVQVAMTLHDKGSTHIDIDGKPIASVKRWPQRAQASLLARIEKDLADRSATAAPLLHALAACVKQHWQHKGSAVFVKSCEYLAGRVSKALAAKTPEQLAKACGGFRHYSKQTSTARSWGVALKQGAAEQNRQLLRAAAKSARVGTLRRIACIKFAAQSNAADPTDVADALKELAKLDKAKTAQAYLPWFANRARRERLQATELDALLVQRASELADEARDAALAEGSPITAACWMLVKHSLTASEAPAPMWSYDALLSNDQSDLGRARKLVSEALVEIAPLAKNQGNIANEVLVGPLTRNWPLTKQLGIDIGPSASLHKHHNLGFAEIDVREHHLITHSDPWHWELRRMPRLLLQYDPLSMERMSTLFVGEELSAKAKALRQKHDELQARSKSLNTRATEYKKTADAHRKVVNAFTASLNNGTADRSTAESRAKEIDNRGREISLLGDRLQADGKQFEKDADAYNFERLAYMNSKSEEQADKHAEIEAQLAASMNALIEQRLEAWAQDKTENDVLWMRWLLGRNQQPLPSIRDILPPNAKRTKRITDQDGVRVFQKSGRHNVGKALASYWNDLVARRTHDRVARMRSLLDRYINTFGLDQAFHRVYMKSDYAQQMRDEVLSKEETAAFKTYAQQMMKDYNEHVRKVNKK